MSKCAFICFFFVFKKSMFWRWWACFFNRKYFLPQKHSTQVVYTTKLFYSSILVFSSHQYNLCHTEKFYDFYSKLAVNLRIVAILVGWFYIYFLFYVEISRHPNLNEEGFLLFQPKFTLHVLDMLWANGHF